MRELAEISHPWGEGTRPTRLASGLTRTLIGPLGRLRKLVMVARDDVITRFALRLAKLVDESYTKARN